MNFVLRRRLVFVVLLALGVLAFSNPGSARSVTVVMLGDSLTAGFGLDPKDSLPVKLEAALRVKGHEVTILNAGVSGDTTSAALERLDWAVPDTADAVIVELGGNDALRAQDPTQTRLAMGAILKRLGERKLPVLVAGMRAPRNLGPDYAERFNPIFEELAREHGALFHPFVLEGVAAVPELNQPDGIHPNPKGVDMMVKAMLPAVERLIARIPPK
jgi:acyl-CoA thioesterase-1